MMSGNIAVKQGAAMPELHHEPQDLSDRLAMFITKCLRVGADLFFAKRYGHRAVVLETVAAVPGMVGATITHLNCLRRMVDDDDWIRTLMDEAENERMHLMTFVEIARPTAFERLVVLVAQGAFYIGYFGSSAAFRRAGASRPAANRSPTSAPALQPTTRSGITRISCSASSTPTCAKPRSPEIDEDHPTNPAPIDSR